MCSAARFATAKATAIENPGRQHGDLVQAFCLANYPVDLECVGVSSCGFFAAPTYAGGGHEQLKFLEAAHWRNRENETKRGWMLRIIAIFKSC